MSIIKPIRTEQDYDEAIINLGELMALDPDPESVEGDQLSILSTLVQNYEETHYPSTLPSPIDALKFRMEQQSLKPTSLVPFIGSRGRVSEILSGKRPLTLEMIRALESGLGIPARVLIQKPSTEVEYIDWSDDLVKEMDSRGYFEKGSFDGNNKDSLLSLFFKGFSPSNMQLAWRKTSPNVSTRTDKLALIAWSQRIQQKAKVIQPKNSYKEGSVDLAFMQRVIRLSTQNGGPILARDLLLEHGIVMVIAAPLPKTKVDGAAILKDKNKPIIGISLRFDRIDNFWFTLLHELAHVSLHLKTGESVFFDEIAGKPMIFTDDREKEANVLAQEAIIPQKIWEDSPAKSVPSSMAALSLAKKLGINVAVAAGIIQYKHKNFYYLSQVVNSDEARVRHYFSESLS